MAHASQPERFEGLCIFEQVVFALVAPGDTVANLAAGAIAEAGAQQAGDMMQVSAQNIQLYLRTLMTPPEEWLPLL